MSMITDVFPPLEIALKLEPEELAVPLLECLCRFEERRETGYMNSYNFTLPSTFKGYCESYKEVQEAVMEAWVWLEREGLVAPQPGDTTGNWIFITRRGKKFRGMTDLKKFNAASLLPHKLIDPQLASKVSSAFLRGEYDLAVFAAFREVEITVRNLGGFGTGDIGVFLMRKAFRPNTGPLTDTQQDPGEQEGVCNLYAGVIGQFKNPSSHRDVNLDDPVEAVELIMFADFLMRLAKRRKPIGQS